MVLSVIVRPPYQSPTDMLNLTPRRELPRRKSEISSFSIIILHFHKTLVRASLFSGFVSATERQVYFVNRLFVGT